MKKYFLLFLTIFVSFACQEEVSFNESLQHDDALITKSSVDETFVYQNNERIIYSSETDFKAWTAIVGLDNRFKACDIPESSAKRMTTKALMESLIHYPLNYLIFAYNNPDDAVKIIVNNSTVHRELLQREDAAKLLVNRYLEARPKRDVSPENSRGHEIRIEDDVFLGFLINEAFLSKPMEQPDLESIKRGIEIKWQDLTNHADVYGTLPLEPLERIGKTIGLTLSRSTRSGGVFQSYTTIYTPFQQSLDGMVFTEFDDSDISYLNSVAIAQYPGATFRGNASARYNCHSYAWHQRETTNSVWLNSISPLTNTYQLSKYWTSDLYQSTTSSNADIVHYSDTDHSAVALTNGNYLSKWGQYPLMEHQYNNCPYWSSNLQYFKEKDLPITNDAVEIIGPSYVLPNVAYNFIITYPGYVTVNYDIFAESMNPDDTVVLNHIGVGNTYSFTCDNYGAYYIYVYGYAGYNNCYLYSCTSHLVICSSIIPMQQDNDDTELGSLIEH